MVYVLSDENQGRINFSFIFFAYSKKAPIFALAKQKNAGAIAQLVEQRTENPCVPGSIPGGTTIKARKPL